MSVVGIGPGSIEHITPKAKGKIQNADVIIGYKTYIDLIKNIIKHNPEIISGTMGKEVNRAKTAVLKALENKDVIVVSSGDPGVYGMAGIILEVVAIENPDIPVEIIPGVTAATAAASKLGAPLVSDFAVISLSDLLTPWKIIERRLIAAAEANFSIVLYNPKSSGRKEPLEKAYNILLKYRNPNTPVGIVKNAGRKGEHAIITKLEKILQTDVDMVTTIIVGNSTTQIMMDLMVTPRGYDLTQK